MEDIMEDNFEKLNLLLEQEQCEFVDIPDGFTGQTESGELRLIYLMNDAVPWEQMGKELDVLLLPAGYAKLCSNTDYAHIQRFGCERQVFTCAYQIDQGSLLYLEDRINELRTKT